MMKLINTFKDSLLELGVMFELFKVGAPKSAPIKAIVYVWGLGWISRLIIILNTVLILICTVLGEWANVIPMMCLTYLTVSTVFYSSKYYELLKSLQDVKYSDKVILKGAAQKIEDGSYSMAVGESLVNNTDKNK